MLYSPVSFLTPLSKVSSACIHVFKRFLNYEHHPVVVCCSFSSPGYDTRFLEQVRPRLAVLERRERTGVAVVGDVSLGQPCWSRISMQPLLPVFLAIIIAVWPWLSFALTSIPYCRGRDAERA